MPASVVTMISCKLGVSGLGQQPSVDTIIAAVVNNKGTHKRLHAFVKEVQAKLGLADKATVDAKAWAYIPHIAEEFLGQLRSEARQAADSAAGPAGM